MRDFHIYHHDVTRKILLHGQTWRTRGGGGGGGGGGGRRRPPNSPHSAKYRGLGCKAEANTLEQ